ncbi:unnamed protein product [Diplocarpon coronariae]|nr:hypothetical protein JHW43_003709 [Diplocarpon mali]
MDRGKSPAIDDTDIEDGHMTPPRASTFHVLVATSPPTQASHQALPPVGPMPYHVWVKKKKDDTQVGSNDVTCALDLMMFGTDESVLKHFVTYSQHLFDDKGVSPTDEALLEALEDIDPYTEGLGNVSKMLSGLNHSISTAIYIPQTDRQRQRSDSGERRLPQHKEHQSSGYLMNLVEAVLRVSHAMFAEVLLTCIGLGHTASGGFSCQQAGISHSVADDGVFNGYYARMQHSLYKKTIFQERMEKQVEYLRNVAAVHEDIIMTVDTFRELGDQLEEQFSRLHAVPTEMQELAEEEAKTMTLISNLEALMDLGDEEWSEDEEGEFSFSC